jgi:hypothetical protein
VRWTKSSKDYLHNNTRRRKYHFHLTRGMEKEDGHIGGKSQEVTLGSLTLGLEDSATTSSVYTGPWPPAGHLDHAVVISERQT